MNVTTFNLGRWFGICATSAMLVAMVATIPGCGTSGRVGAGVNGRFPGGSFYIHGEIRWGEPLRKLPPGSEYLGTTTIRGIPVRVYRGPDGCYYITTPGSSGANKLEGGHLISTYDDQFGHVWPDYDHDGRGNLVDLLDGLIGSPGDPPETNLWVSDPPPDIPLPEDPWIDFSEEDRFARFEFVLPAAWAHNFRHPDTMSFDLTDWGVVVRDGGAMEIFYEASGTDTAITDVLGAAMLQGFKSITMDDPAVGLVRVELDSHFTAAFFTRDGKAAPNGYAIVPLPQTRDP